jgi:diguanylate cyclase (GGDEF)-like protein/PAS domain S-box-containing protein
MKNMFRSARISVSVSAALTLTIGLVITSLLFAFVRRAETRAPTAQFHQEAARRINLVADGMNDAVEQLAVLKQVFSSFDVRPDQFTAFTAPLLTRYPVIQALTFQRYLSDRDRAHYEATMRKSHPGFQITELTEGGQRPAKVRQTYNVVEYVEPFARNAAALGLDTAHTNAQFEARMRSRKTGQIAATGVMPLIRDPNPHLGFLVLAPLFARGAPLQTEKLRQRAVIGELAAVLRIDRLVQTLLGDKRWLATPGIAVSLFAAATAQPDHLAFQNGVSPSRLMPSLVPNWLLYDIMTPETATFTVAGNPWHMEVAMAPVLFTKRQSGSLYVLLGGLISSLLATGYVYSLVSRKFVIERITGERTLALRTDNRRLSEELEQSIRTEQSLRLREKVIHVSSNAIIICKAQGPDYPIEYVNPAFESITGYTAGEVVGKSLESLQNHSQNERNLEEIRAALEEKREGHAQLRNYRKDGTAYWNDLFISPLRDDAGAIVNFVVVQYDISAVMHFEAELEYQAHHDALTGLANRNLLYKRLEHAIAQVSQSGSELWLVFIDLDRFKYVNDTLGHEAGDMLLKTLAERIQLVVRDTDTLARMGGDEFMLVLAESGDRNASLGVLQEVMNAVASPLLLQSREFRLTCSMGIAVFPNDGDDVATLTRHADIAMYGAKAIRGNSYKFYTNEMSTRTLERVQLEEDLHHALERGEFLLYYQPQIDLRKGTIVGMEALLRWNRPNYGIVGPKDFISIAEDMGLIVPIGAWVVRTACEQTKAWHRAGFGQLRVAVNVSSLQFTHKGLAQSIAEALYETGLDAHFLELELTESSVMEDVENAVIVLQELKRVGVHIAIDDFGTGHSSLSYLRRFPIDVLKIDKSFVNDITLGEDGAAIVRTIISLAHSLRLTVSLDAFSDDGQRTYLREHGCDQMQGYLVSRPLMATDFEALIDNDHVIGMYISNELASA